MPQYDRPRLLSEPLPLGKTGIVMTESPTEAGTKLVTFSVDAEAVLVSLFVESVSGDLDVSIKTLTEDDHTFLVAVLPTVSAPTTELLIKKAATVMGRVLIEATYTGATVFEIRARGISSAEASVKVLGATDAAASSTTIGAAPAIIIGSALSDRSGVVIKNNNLTAGRLFLGFSAAQASLSVGYPIGPQEALALDVDAGVVIWGMADSGTIDIRILEAGG